MNAWRIIETRICLLLGKRYGFRSPDFPHSDEARVWNVERLEIYDSGAVPLAAAFYSYPFGGAKQTGCGMSRLTVAICSYNRAYRLHNLVTALRAQKCPVPFEILIVDNNCTDNTQQVVQKLSKLNGVPLRYIKERQQGIVYARNRAIEETKNSTYLAYIDDDEFPLENWLKAAVDALEREGADCVGGGIRISLPFTKRIPLLKEELLGFLGAVNYSSG